MVMAFYLLSSVEWTMSRFAIWYLSKLGEIMDEQVLRFTVYLTQIIEIERKVKALLFCWFDDTDSSWCGSM